MTVHSFDIKLGGGNLVMVGADSEYQELVSKLRKV